MCHLDLFPSGSCQFILGFHFDAERYPAAGEDEIVFIEETDDESSSSQSLQSVRCCDSIDEELLPATDDEMSSSETSSVIETVAMRVTCTSNDADSARKAISYGTSTTSSLPCSWLLPISASPPKDHYNVDLHRSLSPCRYYFDDESGSSCQSLSLESNSSSAVEILLGHCSG